MRHAWQGSHTASCPTKGNSLSILASGVLRAARSVPWSGGPAGDDRSNSTFLGGRAWEKRSLETAAPWNTGRVSRPISWGHWQETGTVGCGVHHSSPEGPALKNPGPLASGRSSRRLSSENDGPSSAWECHSDFKILESTRSDVPWMRSWNTIGAAPPSSPCWPPQPPRRKRGKHCALTREISQEAPVYHI